MRISQQPFFINFRPTRPAHPSRTPAPPEATMQAQDILDFWFTELTEKQRFAKYEALDTTLRESIGATLQAVRAVGLAGHAAGAVG